MINHVNIKTFNKYRESLNIEEKITILKLLGYDISRNRNQGKIYVSYNQIEKILISDYYTYLQNEIKLGKKYTSKKFYYKTNIVETVKKHYNCQTKKNVNRKLRKCKNYIKDEELLKKLNKIDKIHAVSRFPYTNILAIDIDNHDNNPEESLRAFQYIVKKYYKSIVYTEISQDLGFHIFLNTKHLLSQEKLQEIQKIFNKIFPSIDIIGAKNQKQLLRLIDSPHYIPIEFNKNLTKLYEISEEKYTQKILNFNFKENKAEFKKEFDVADNLNLEKIENEEIIPIFSGRNIKKETNNFQNKNNIINKLKTRYTFGAGERVQYMFTIASACYFYNLNADEFIEITLANNNGSKDLKKWNFNKINNIYTKFYNRFIEEIDKKQQNENNTFNYKSKKQKQFISNLKYLEESKNIITESGIDLFINTFINEILKKEIKYQKWQEEYIKIAPILIKEIFGFIIFNANNPQQRNSNSTLTYNKFRQIKRGFQFSRYQLELFKEKYNSPVNIHKLYNLIINNTIFQQIYSNNLGYCFNDKYKFSRQFRLKKPYNNTENTYIKIIKNIIIYLKKIKKTIYTSTYKISNIMLNVLMQVDDFSLYKFDFFAYNFP